MFQMVDFKYCRGIAQIIVYKHTNNITRTIIYRGGEGKSYTY